MHRLIRPGRRSRSVVLGRDKFLVLYEDGPARFEHVCQRPDGPFITSPDLSDEHVVSTDDNGKVTVRPSVLCPDCNAHGFITNSTWEDL